MYQEIKDRDFYMLLQLQFIISCKFCDYSILHVTLGEKGQIIALEGQLVQNYY